MQLITDATIPQYSFEPDAVMGNTLFRIDRNDCIMSYRRSDMLVPHRKNYYFMSLVRRGSSRHWIDQVPYVIKPDHFYFTVPQQIHLKEAAQPFTGITLSFTEEFLGLDESGTLKQLPLIANPDHGHELKLSNADVSFVDDLLNKIMAEYHAKSKWQQSMLLAYMKVLVIHLSRLYTEQLTDSKVLPERTLLNRYLAHVDTWHKQHHEVGHYAGLMNLSAGHLSELIKDQSGRPAIAHIHERLIVEARRLLFHTERSVKEVAFELGFEDASYFNRFFKRLTGDTPVAYRQTTREMYH
ncbi:helix-turn-helix transcriptional regulator [Mucilaginibacter daejeonensis]|uniref:AraC family transcriptional regulator n=1 Tax=Mucilaginibacter daejeonensis TaxID=398049 RepID=UPI001D17139B|nr:helix-turn-helix transcriptional regulator [Mucilaginibacter daejeonensis]UEG53770.1 helix-turn-helix transcriptional regulator [Mucilaginibacter daejeonensis]